MFVVAAIQGPNGGVIAGLAVTGVVFASVANAAEMMQDFQTGYLTLSSARAMFSAQVYGSLIGCIVCPAW